MQCSEESVENIAILSKILRYIAILKFDIFLMIRYNTIYRYRKRYIDIFDISNRHYSAAYALSKPS